MQWQSYVRHMLVTWRRFYFQTFTGAGNTFGIEVTDAKLTRQEAARVSTGEKARIVRFGNFEVDLRSGELRRNGFTLRMQGQPFQILAMLLEHPGELVTREEIRDRLWPANTFVDFDHSLNAAVKRLREALGDSAESPLYVETLARRGYRFVGNVDTQTAGQSSLSEPKSTPANADRRTSWWPMAVAVFAVVAIAGIAAAFFQRRHPSESNLSLPLPALQRLTTNSAQNGIVASAISPDGNYLAYSDKTGLYLRLLSTGELHSLLSGTSKVTSLAWFHDSSQILASWPTPSGEKQLWALSILGGNPRRMSDEGFAPSASRDGSKIVFLKGADFAETGHEIWLMRSNGADQRMLVSFPEGKLATPVWSPDGRWIAYVKYKSEHNAEETSIELFDVNRATTKTLLSQQPVMIWGMSWLPDARLIYATPEPPPSQASSNFWAARIDLSSGSFTETPARLTAGDGYVVQPSITSDGKRLAFNRARLQHNIYIADFSAKELRLGTPQQLTSEDADDIPFDWTLDNQAVLFISNRTGAANIFLQPTNETSAKMLLSDGERKTICRLSPDGIQVLYLVSGTPDDNSQMIRLMRAPINGGPPHVVVEARGLNNFQCSRGQSNVCVLSQEENGDLVFSAFDITVGKPRELGKFQKGGDWNWSLSPDGTLIAGIAFDVNDNRIHLLPLSGKPAHDLAVKRRAGFNSIDWAADSKALFVSSNSTGFRQNLLYVDLAGNARRIWESDSVSPNWAVPSRDGKHVAMPVFNINSNVWITENF